MTGGQDRPAGEDTSGPPYSDEYWMSRALALADEAAGIGEVPVGAVLVQGEEEIGAGYNCPISACDPSAHAEMVAIRSAARLCAAGWYAEGSVPVPRRAMPPDTADNSVAERCRPGCPTPSGPD